MAHHAACALPDGKTNEMLQGKVQHIVPGHDHAVIVDALCRQRLLIPSYPPERTTTESLNVAMATGIVLAEFRRQQSSL
jgi:tRNA(Leu) C34 or U34 (ribose-2'-O)-methylase TrmL